MKDLIIGCSTNYDWSVLKYWINSINKSGFTGDKVLILMNCPKETVERVVAAGFNVVAFAQDENGNLVHNSNLMVHVERFLHIYNYLRQREGEYRYVITTDVKDVVFQSNPARWIWENIGDKKLIFASESMKYKDEPWGNQNLLETYGAFFHDIFKENEIYNVGVLAGEADYIRDLCANIFTTAVTGRIPICDQSTFNFMISQHPYKDVALYAKSEDGWACQLGTTVDPNKSAEFGPKLLESSPVIDLATGKIVTTSGNVFPIIHQYDRVPLWKSIIEGTYND